MMHVRMTLIAVALLCALTMVGCNGPTDPGPTQTEDPYDSQGCGECADEVGDLRSQLQELDGAKLILTLDRYPGTPTNGPGIRIEMLSTQSGDSGLVDSVAEAVWLSRVSPLTELWITIEGADGELMPSSAYSFVADGRQYDNFVAKWGQRPVE